MVKFLLAVNCLIVLIAINNIKANSISDTKSKCDIRQDGFPIDQLLTPKLISTSDRTTLLNVTSYLILLNKEETGYVPLEVQSITQTPFAEEATTLKLDFGCAQYEISVSRDSQSKDYKITNISARMDNNRLACSHQPGLTFPLGKRFSCLGRLVFTCNAHAADEAKQMYSRPTAEIVFPNGLEIELERVPTDNQKDEFSKEAHVESCPK